MNNMTNKKILTILIKIVSISDEHTTDICMFVRSQRCAKLLKTPQIKLRGASRKTPQIRPSPDHKHHRYDRRRKNMYIHLSPTLPSFQCVRQGWKISISPMCQTKIAHLSVSVLHLQLCNVTDKDGNTSIYSWVLDKERIFARGCWTRIKDNRFAVVKQG